MRYLGLGLCHTEITPKKVDLRRKGSLKMRYNTRLVVYCHIYTGGGSIEGDTRAFWNLVLLTLSAKLGQI